MSQRCPRSTPPQQQPSARPEALTRNQVKKNANTTCLLSTPRPAAMIATLRRSPAAAAARAQPPHLEEKSSLQKKKGYTWMCLAHLPVQLAPAMMPVQRRPSAASRSRGRRRGPLLGRCLPGGAAILPPKSSPPGESVVIASWSSNETQR